MNDGISIKHVILLWSVVLMTSQLQAQINWITDNRYVTVSGYAQIPTEVSSNYSATATPSVSFASFNGDISGEADESISGLGGTDGNSNAKQLSSLTGSQFGFNSEVEAGTGGSGENVASYSEADSFCELTFSVTAPQAWVLTLGWLNLPYRDISIETSLLDTPVSGPVQLLYQGQLSQGSSGFTASGSPIEAYGYPQSYQGILMPGDTYTLDVFINAYQNDGDDPLGDTSDLNYGLNFSVVPEPSSDTLMAIGLVGLTALRRKSLVKS